MTRFVTSVLEGDGFTHVFGLNDPAIALTEIYRFQPDLILLDISMPEVNGLEILEAIQADEHLREVSVLMLSASTKQWKYRALNMGAIDFINKPVKADELLARVRKTLRVI